MYINESYNSVCVKNKFYDQAFSSLQTKGYIKSYKRNLPPKTPISLKTSNLYLSFGFFRKTFEKGRALFKRRTNPTLLKHPIHIIRFLKKI